MDVGNIANVLRTDSDSEEEFVQLLNDMGNPSLPWDQMRLALAAESRYLALSTDAHRRQVFLQWCSKQTASTTHEIEFLKFVHKNYRPAMIYPLFRRRFGRSPEISELPIPEKGKESLFREYVAYVSSDNKTDFVKKKPMFADLI